MIQFLKDLLSNMLKKDSINLEAEAWNNSKLITPYEYAHKFLGISETTHAELIESFHESVGLKNCGPETPWCSSFVSYCFIKTGFEGAKSAWARDWLKIGEAVTTPAEGDLVVLTRGTSAGHIAFFVREAKEKDFIVCLSGNQDNMVCEKPYHKNRVLGYRSYK